jgi:hypothetical protein
MRERNVCEFARRIREDAEPHPGSLEAAELCTRLCPRPEMDRSAVVGEALEQWPPVAQLFVENPRRLDSIFGYVELDVSPPRDVLEPVAPQRPGVREDGIEIEGNCLQALDARLALLTGER